MVHPSSPWTSVKQLVDDTKANPGKINYAHTGAGGLPHLAGELFMLRSGAKMTGVSYRSGGELVTAVLSQAVHATFENIAILVPQIRDGKLRALAAQNATRTTLLPDLPTMAEVGIPNAEANTFFGLVAPAGTPANIIKTLNEALNDGMQDAGDSEADHQCRLGIEAQLAGGVCRLHRRPAPQVAGGRQGRGREDQLNDAG